MVLSQIKILDFSSCKKQDDCSVKVVLIEKIEATT